MSAPGLIFEGLLEAGGRRLLGPLRLEVPGGRWTCLLGPSGIGKSSILHCFAGIAAGVTLQGACRADDGLPLQGRIALMAQKDMLLPWLTAAENVALGARLRGGAPDPARAEALLAEVGLAGCARQRPETLSGGQRQRVALARTLFEDRPVVLLDEPFSTLDLANRVRMQDLAARLLRGRTVLQVTHDPAEAARLGDEILLLGGEGPVRIAPPGPAPRAPDAVETLSMTGALTRRLLAA